MTPLKGFALPVLALALMTGCGPQAAMPQGAAPPAAPAGPVRTADSAPRPVLSVQTATLERSDWQASLSASGIVAPAQEISIASELTGARIARLLVEPGQPVRQGQLLAELQAPALEVERALAEAALQEAQVTARDARDNARRAQTLQATAAMSGQQIREFLNQEAIAEARLTAASARLELERRRVQALRVTAPQGGIILSRPSTVGQLVAPERELYRLNPQGRLEWRAEIGSTELALVSPGQIVSVLDRNGHEVRAVVRALSADASGRQPVVHVDLPAGADWRAGSLVRGAIHLGPRQSWTLPASAVLMRQGTGQVAVVGADQRVSLRTIGIGRRLGDRLEVTSGLSPGQAVVLEGGSFLQDGDRVQVVAGMASAEGGASAAAKAPP